MKKMKLVYLIAAMIVAVIITAASTGCKTSDVQNTIKAEGVLITAVDTGMNVWHDYVVAHLTDGKVTQAQIDTVKTAYNAYADAQAVAKAAIEKLLTHQGGTQSDVDAANAAVTAAEIKLLSIFNQFIK